MGKQIKKNQGFTLVELAIVLIIIAFLIVGISTGTNLIQQATLNSVISDMQSYQTAYKNFVSRYNEIPGDMIDADYYWPQTGSTPCAVTGETCNGNGNEIIDAIEIRAAWKELSLAGIINQNIATIPSGWGAGNFIEVPGLTTPVSKIDGAGYTMVGSGIQIGISGIPGVATSPWSNSSNAVFVAKPSATNGLGASALSSSDAFNIDQKIDDGDIDSNGDFIGATTGNFRSVNGSDISIFSGGCTVGAELGGSSTTLNEYELATSGLSCVSGLGLN